LLVGFEKDLVIGEMLILSREEIAKSITMEEAIRAVEAAFAAHVNGYTMTPPRISMTTPDNHGHFLCMPSLVDDRASSPALSVKVYSEFSQNPQRGLSLAYATFLLIDPMNGQPRALLEGMYLTGLRTGAASAVAARYLARRNAERLGLIGTGFQAFFQAWAISQVRPIKHLVIYDRSSATMHAFAKRARRKLRLSVSCARSPDEVVASADILVTATNSCEPVFEGAKLRDGTMVIAIGSFHPQEREVDSKTIMRSKIYVDSYEGALAEAGDLLIPIKKGEISRDDIKGELGELVTRRVPGRQSDEEVTLFKAVGLAIEDAVVAKAAYVQAVEKHLGSPVFLFNAPSPVI
jgi:ornithine cyclodeaminase/alanine dehydrogenase